MKLLNRLNFLVRMPFFGVLLIVLIIAMALGTFIESARDTNTAWAVIYDAWWFEVIFGLVVINLVGNILRFKLYRKAKIGVFIFHLAFLFIIIGGAITRFTSVDGMMHIREGATSGSIISNASYIDIQLNDDEDQMQLSHKLRISELTPRRFNWKGNFDGRNVKIKSVDYIRNGTVQYVAGPGGEPVIQMMLLAGGRQVTTGLKSGDVVEYPGLSLSFNNPAKNIDLSIVSGDSGLVAYSAYPVSIMIMGSGDNVVYNPGEPVPFEQARLYTVNDVRIAMQRYMPSAFKKYVKAGNSGQGTGLDVVKLEVDIDGMKSDLYLQGLQNMVGQPETVRMGSTSVTGRFGSHSIQLPFALKLEDFRVDRYAGSMSPSSFESDVILMDTDKDIYEKRNIYMNNVLKHRGYRFYQSSYDQDEHGSILSVKQDYTGTVITYIGYLLLAVGMFMSLFGKGTRFHYIAKFKANAGAKAVIAILLLASPLLANAQSYPAPSKEVAEEFGKLWTQGKEGRFKPMNTLSNEVMRKVVKDYRFEGLTPDQVMLGIIAFPEEWNSIPLFEVDNPEIHKLLGYKGTKVSFNDFMGDGNYLLYNLVNEAYQKPVAAREDLDKEVMKLDEKINVYYMVETGSILRIYPDPTDTINHKWHSVSELYGTDMNPADSLGLVFSVLANAVRTGDNAQALEVIDFIGKYQQKFSTHELVGFKMKAELLLNKLRIFNRLTALYALLGITLLILQLMRVFKSRKGVDVAFRAGFIVLVVLFAFHVTALALRWYVGNHAPLSNGYESMIYVSGFIILFGLLFSRVSGFAAGLATLLATLSLLVAHMSWMNPDITNLVPVLKSPWLTIHVNVILAGYALLGISMFMGLLNLVFYTALNEKNVGKTGKVIDQLTGVSQLVVTIGLYLLTIGTFLGGVWANESWGRYWGWDPKETWALISVLVYSFVAHMHRFPGLGGNYSYNLGTMSGYFAILMTYFGVNYFLGGIHSYAAGAAFDIPIWVFLAILALITLSVIAYMKNKKFNKMLEN